VLFAAFAAAHGGAPQAKTEPPKQQPPQSPAAEQYQALLKEYNAALQDYSKAIQAAQTDDERQKVFEQKYPQPQKYAPRFLKLAQDFPKDPAAVDALVWVATRAGSGPEVAQALEILARDHVASDKIGQVCASLVYATSAQAEPFLKDVLAKNPDRGVRGQAALALGQYLKRQAETVRGLKEDPTRQPRLAAQYGADRVTQMMGQDPDAILKEAEKLFEGIAKDYADVKVFNRPLGPTAEGELFELRHLSVGQVAPEIEAEDIDGVKFKLSDYRGKVVMLDFWGHW